MTEEFETTENDGTDDEKVLEQGYDVQLTFEDDSTAELHAFPFGDIEKGDLCYADDVAYLTYTSIESKEQIDTKEAELAVKQAAEQKKPQKKQHRLRQSRKPQKKQQHRPQQNRQPQSRKLQRRQRLEKRSGTGSSGVQTAEEFWKFYK